MGSSGIVEGRRYQQSPQASSRFEASKRTRSAAVQVSVFRSLRALLFCTLLAATGAQATTRVAIPGAEINVEFAGESARPDRAMVLAWVKSAATAVETYYGKFPVASVDLRIVPGAGRGISGGRTWAYRGAEIRIRVGESATEGDLKNDWVLVHEMTHLAFPSLSDAHDWLEEGLATYVESIARAQAGQLSVEKVWADFIDGMPKGLPQSGDRGLDRTHTWGRTYWGGALFCLLADPEIRRRTENRLGLQDALRTILATGNMETESELEPLLAIGDRAVGVSALTELYGRMKDRPVNTDLDALWRRLGIERQGRTVRFIEDAPEAALRRAITTTRN